MIAGGVMGLIPLTGMAMPFLAQGGSSVVTNWIIVALLIRLSDVGPHPRPRHGPAAPAGEGQRDPLHPARRRVLPAAARRPAGQRRPGPAHQADYLTTNPANRRTAIDRYDQPRGDIVVGGRPVTGSKDTGEQLALRAHLRHGPLYAPVTGYASQTYGTTLLENAEDGILSGTDPILAPLPLWGDITRSQQPGGNVVTTVEDSMQRAAYEGLDGRRGAVAALDPATGRILALVSSPSYDPEVLSGTGRP